MILVNGFSSRLVPNTAGPSLTTHNNLEEVFFLAKVITVSNQKGGVGKTTTVNALASVFRRKGFKVLCVDFDPQGNLSFGFQADAEMSATIYNTLKKEISAQFSIQHTPIGDIIPANILLSGIEVEFTGKGREFLLRDALKSILDLYDYIFIDSPPGLGALTVNAFAASDSLLIPLLPDIYSLQGIARIGDTIDRVRKSCNPKLTVGGAFLVQYNAMQNLCKQTKGAAQMIARDYHIPFMKTTIRRGVVLAQAQTLQEDILDYAPKNNAVLDYLALADELLRRGL